MKAATGALAVALVIVAEGSALRSAGGLHALRYLMGTWCDLAVLDPHPDAAAAEAAFQEIARLERVMSNWDPASEVSGLNVMAGRGPQPVSRDLAAVVREAEDLCTSSGGAFDLTVGPLLDVWGFNTEWPNKPSPERAREAASRVGCNRVSVDVDRPSIALADGTRLDLGGIGKGYAVDRALAVLDAHGVTRAKLDFGSSSLGFIGSVAGGWPIVVADPRDRDRPLLSFRIEHGAVSSSSQRGRSFVRDGHRYGHIFDPRTGVPVESSLLAVTVIAPKASTADGLSTALLVLGTEHGARLVSRVPGVGAIFVEERPGDGLAITTAGRFDRLTRLSR